MNDNRSYVEEHARYVVRMAGVLVASHNTVKYNAGIWKSSSLDNAWADTPSIGGIGRTKMRVHDILNRFSPNTSLVTKLTHVIRTIGFAVRIFITQVPVGGVSSNENTSLSE